jgi:serine kinase of HPr protein (carbohydrate metabolism regulator)
MQESYSVKLKQLVERMKLEIVYTTKDYENVSISTSDIYRPVCSWPDFMIFSIPAHSVDREDRDGFYAELLS